MKTRKNYREVVDQGLKLLTQEENGIGYTYKEVIGKLAFFDVEVSPGVMSKLKRSLKEGKKIDFRKLKRIGEGLEEIISGELQMIFDPEIEMFIEDPEIEALPFPIPVPSPAPMTLPFIYHDGGRLVTPKKIDFINSSTKEIIEFGVKLEQFKNYFTTRADNEYKDHIIELLRRGINMKYYMLEPYSDAAQTYFKQRATADKEELAALSKLPRILDKLIQIAKELDSYGYPGKFELYTYNIIPYSHFLSVDQGSKHAKMMVSHYIYGVKRAKAPVVEFTKESNPGLYKRYLTSLEAYRKQSKQVQIH